MKLRTFGAAVGGLLIVIGVVLALLPVSYAGVSCGSVVSQQSPQTDLAVTQVLADAGCQSARDGRFWWAAGLAVVGLIVLVGSLLVRSPESQPAQ